MGGGAFSRCSPKPLLCSWKINYKLRKTVPSWKQTRDPQNLEGSGQSVKGRGGLRHWVSRGEKWRDSFHPGTELSVIL